MFLDQFSLVADGFVEIELLTVPEGFGKVIILFSFGGRAVVFGAMFGFGGAV